MLAAKEHHYFYESPIGKILLSFKNEALQGLWFEGQKYYASNLGRESLLGLSPATKKVIQWLDMYFSGDSPEIDFPLFLDGTDFRVKVWKALETIPYGKVVTYSELASYIYGKPFAGNMARAVGGAVGHNPISIIVPCHRVVGAKDNLTGYAGGLWRKSYLLDLEKSFLK